MDLAKLYRRFYRWYNDKISHVDFGVIEQDIRANKARYGYLERKFKERLDCIHNMMSWTYYSKDKVDQLQLLDSDSFEELDIKLTIRGY